MIVLIWGLGDGEGVEGIRVESLGVVRIRSDLCKR